MRKYLSRCVASPKQLTLRRPRARPPASPCTLRAPRARAPRARIPCTVRVHCAVQAEHTRATGLIETHRDALLALVDELMEKGQITPARFAAVVGLPLGKPEDVLDPYAQRLAAFRVERPERLRA